MKEFVLVFIIAIGIAGVGAGFAQNTILLSLEDLGLGEDFLKSPITSFTVSLEKTRTCQGAACRNLVTACKFESVDSIPGPATIICKLTDGSGITPDPNDIDKFGKVIAEGKVCLVGGYSGNHLPLRIPIDQKAFPNSNDVRVVKDIKIVTLGPPPTGGSCSP